MIKWNKEMCLSEARKYTCLKDFRKKSQSAYISSLRNGWLKEYSWLKRDISIKWTHQKVVKAAKLCTTLKEFRCNYSFAYRKALKYKWIDEFSWLSRSTYCVDKPDWTVYIYNILDKYIYVGLTVDIKRRDKEHLSKKKDTVFKFCKKSNIKLPLNSYIIIKENLTAMEAQKLEDEQKLHYLSLGYEIINSGKTGAGIGSLGSGIRKWTKDTCMDAAKLCKTKKEFKAKYPRAYNVSNKNNWSKDYTWLEEIPVDGRKFTTIYKYSKTGEFLGEYNGSVEAAKSCNKPDGRSSISKVCRKEKLTAFGFRWSYTKL